MSGVRGAKKRSWEAGTLRSGEGRRRREHRAWGRGRRTDDGRQMTGNRRKRAEGRGQMSGGKEEKLGSWEGKRRKTEGFEFGSGNPGFIFRVSAQK